MRATFFTLILATMLIHNTTAQTPYTVTIDVKNITILNGIITKYAIENNAAFDNWYGNSQKIYTPEASIVKDVASSKGKVQFVIFGGTWCEDTQFILPKFFKLQQAAGIADNAISLYGVDRSKKTLGNLNDAFKITNVPTIIVMKDGKEIGRVVEYGKTGKWDTELAAIVKSM